MTESAGNRAIARSTATSYLRLAVTAAVQFAMVPLLLGHLGAEGYGQYALMLSVIGLLALLELGAGAGAVRAAAAGAITGPAERNRLLSAQLAIGLATGALGFIILLAVAPHFGRWFGLPADVHAEVTLTRAKGKGQGRRSKVKGLQDMAYHVVVCAGIVPDPLQSLEPVVSPAGPGLKNEAMLPAVLDPWASHALYEAANLAKNHAGSKLWVVSLAPKAKLQQVMMTVAQKVPFELVALDGPASGFTDAMETGRTLAEAIKTIPGLDRGKLLVFGGWESASRGAGVTMQVVGEVLGLTEQFQGVDELKVQPDGSFEVLERVEGGKHQVSKCAGAPALLGLYMCTEEYSPKHDRGVIWNDPDINIPWAITEPLLSDKDRIHPRLREADINFQYPS